MCVIEINNINFICCHLGETDWKLIAIDINDPLAEELNGNLRTDLKISKSYVYLLQIEYLY